MFLANKIYLDANAGSPLKPNVLEAIAKFLELPRQNKLEPVLQSNPSSIHAHGRRTKSAVAEAREKIAASLGKKTDPEQLIFTSGGTESNQFAVRSLLEPRILKNQKSHWITTEVEHDSNLSLIEWARDRGVAVDCLPVDGSGCPRFELLPSLIKEETVLLSIVWVNNETGVIADLEALKPYLSNLEDKSIYLHLDAAQAWGKIPIDLEQTGAHFVSFAGHKIGALSGTGLLWTKPRTPVEPFLLGKQEKGRRGGTENVLGIVSLGAAAEAIDPAAWDAKLRPLRDALENDISSQISGVNVNGIDANRVANTSNFSFQGISGESLVMALDLEGISVSAGSACASGVLEPSHVLKAMGRSDQEALAAVRVSLTEWTTEEELRVFSDKLKGVVERLRKVSPGLTQKKEKGYFSEAGRK